MQPYIFSEITIDKPGIPWTEWNHMQRLLQKLQVFLQDYPVDRDQAGINGENNNKWR